MGCTNNTILCCNLIGFNEGPTVTLDWLSSEILEVNKNSWTNLRGHNVIGKPLAFYEQSHSSMQLPLA